jgi:hypothetical protein
VELASVVAVDETRMRVFSVTDSRGTRELPLVYVALESAQNLDGRLTGRRTAWVPDFRRMIHTNPDGSRYTASNYCDHIAPVRAASGAAGQMLFQFGQLDGLDAVLYATQVLAGQVDLGDTSVPLTRLLEEGRLRGRL